MKKYCLMIILVLLLASGCGNKNKLIGKWKAENANDEYYYTFNKDKTCGYETAGARLSCTYEFDNEKVTILYKGNDNAIVYEYKVEGNTLTIKDSFGNSIIYKK